MFLLTWNITPANIFVGKLFCFLYMAVDVRAARIVGKKVIKQKVVGTRDTASFAARSQKSR